MLSRKRTISQLLIIYLQNHRICHTTKRKQSVLVRLLKYRKLPKEQTG